MGGRSWLTKAINAVNLIVDFFMDPCDAPFSVYLETLFPALMDLLADLFMFDITEYQQQRWLSHLLPKNQKSLSKVRRGGKGGGRKRWWSIFETLAEDPGEMLGKKNARNFGGNRRLLTGGRAHLWLLAGGLQRAAFWLWFISRGGQFFYDWWAGLISKGYCSERKAGTLMAYEEVDSSHALFGWAPVAIWTVLKQRGDCNWNVSYGYCAFYSMIVVYRCTMDQGTVQYDNIVRFKVSIWNPDEEKEIFFKQYNMRPETTVNAGFSFEVPAGYSFAIEVWNKFGLVNLRDCWLHEISNWRQPIDDQMHIARDFRGRRPWPKFEPIEWPDFDGDGEPG